MYIITGGAGFLGSAMAWRLNKAGCSDIIIVDNLASTEKWKNLVGLKYTQYVHRDAFIQMVRQKNLPWENITAIVHMGACSDTTERNADFLMENNVHYTQTLCLYALERGIRFINASSAATYGDGSKGFDDAVHKISQLTPLNMYGYSKQLVDLWLLREKLENTVVSLKFFNVYGPNEYHKDAMRSVVCKAFQSIKTQGKVQLFQSYREGIKHGGQQRDFVYVKDCVELMWWLLENPEVNGIHNVGFGKARSWNELARAVFTAMGHEENIEYIPMPDELQGKYQYFTEATMDWLKEKSCPVTFATLEQGVADYVNTYLEQSYAYLQA